MLHLLINGFLIGLAVAAPVGPVGLLCIRRSMGDGRLIGFFTGLGAAVADALMALLAALGVRAVARFFETHQTSFSLVGGLVLVVMGIQAVRARPAAKTVKAPLHARSLFNAFGSTLALTLANPMTIGGMLLFFSTFGIAVGTTEYGKIGVLVGSVFAGSTCWWLILSSCAVWFGHHLQDRLLRTINIVTGLIIILIGVWQLARLLPLIT
jgi:threonine/homoserine/homoserine lactone efflux protein